ncbi:hypothetical protein [Solidesulfovibrio sp.]
MSRKRKATQAWKVGAPSGTLAGKQVKPVAALSHLEGMAGADLRLELLRQGALLGVQSMQFMAALKRVAELGMRIQGIVQGINAMPDAEVRRHLADIVKARGIMDAALRLGGEQREAAPQPGAMEVPGCGRRQ